MVALVVGASSLFVAALEGQTLEQAVRLMMHTEPELQAANYDRLSAVEDWRAAKGDLRPQVSIDGSAGFLKRNRSSDGFEVSTGDGLFSRQVGLSIRQLLFDGGFTRQEVESLAHQWSLQEYDQRSMLEMRVVDFCEVYLEIIRAKDQVLEAKEHVNRHGEIRDMIRQKIGAGGNRADLALVDGRLSLAVNSLETQQLAYENAQRRFVRLTGRPSNRLSWPEIPILPASPNGLSIDKNWEYQASIEALGVAQHRYKSITGRRAPKVYLDAGGSIGQDVLGIAGRDDEVRALITFQWDLVTGGKNKALQKREHWQLKKFEELMVAAREEAEYNRDTLWKERMGSVASVKALQVYVKRLEGVLADYDERFKVGRQELLNILDVQSELYGARTQLVDAEFNVNASVYRIVGTCGTLVSSLLSEDEIEAYLKRVPEGNSLPGEVSQQIKKHYTVTELMRPSAREVSTGSVESKKRERFRLFPKKSQ